MCGWVQDKEANGWRILYLKTPQGIVKDHHVTSAPDVHVEVSLIWTSFQCEAQESLLSFSDLIPPSIQLPSTVKSQTYMQFSFPVLTASHGAEVWIPVQNSSFLTLHMLIVNMISAWEINTKNEAMLKKILCVLMTTRDSELHQLIIWHTVYAFIMVTANQSEYKMNPNFRESVTLSWISS